MTDLPRSVTWDNGVLTLLDQRKLPHAEEVRHCQNLEDVYDAIQTLTVRGAPAIGIAAAYGLLLGLAEHESGDLIEELDRRCEYLISARPTAVNLFWALDRMQRVCPCTSQALLDEAKAIHAQDAQMCLQIGEHTLALIKRLGELVGPNYSTPGILTHCNAGALATGGIGTATAGMYLAHEQGIAFRVYADETRPLLQGSRLGPVVLPRPGSRSRAVQTSPEHTQRRGGTAASRRTSGATRRAARPVLWSA